MKFCSDWPVKELKQNSPVVKLNSPTVLCYDTGIKHIGNTFSGHDHDDPGERDSLYINVVFLLNVCKDKWFYFHS